MKSVVTTRPDKPRQRHDGGKTPEKQIRGKERLSLSQEKVANKSQTLKPTTGKPTKGLCQLAKPNGTLVDKLEIPKELRVGKPTLASRGIRGVGPQDYG